MLKSVIKEELAGLVVSGDVSISEAFARLDAAGIGALAICSPDYELRGILTDGDLRRALINRKSFDAPCQTIASKNPIVAPSSITQLQALHLMNQHDIDHLPVVDANGVLQDLLLRRDLVVRLEIGTDASELLETVMFPPGASIAEAVTKLDKAGIGALVLCGPDRVLIGLLTDGDIRRAILRGVPLSTPCEKIVNREPLTIVSSMCAADALELMVKHDINHLPVVDEAGCLIKFLLRRNLAQPEQQACQRLSWPADMVRDSCL